jgi:hypothetical protein
MPMFGHARDWKGCSQQRPFQAPITPAGSLTDNISSENITLFSGIGYFSL